MREVLSFCSGTFELCLIPRCCAACLVVWCTTFRDSVMIPSSSCFELRRPMCLGHKVKIASLSVRVAGLLFRPAIRITNATFLMLLCRWFMPVSSLRRVTYICVSTNCRSDPLIETSLTMNKAINKSCMTVMRSYPLGTLG